MKLQLLALLLLINSVMFSQIYVDVDNTSATKNGTSWATAYTSINTAIANAASGSEIRIAKGTYQEATIVVDDLTLALQGGYPNGGGDQDIPNNLTILDGNNNDRVFASIGTAAVTIDGLTIQNGNTSGKGGGIENSATLYITNSSIINNSATSLGVGGGISNSGTLTITDSFVNDNLSGGGIYNEDTGSVTILNSSVNGNERGDSNFNSSAGGIVNNGSLNISNSSIDNNIGYAFNIQGGAGIENISITTSTTKASLILTNSSVNNNIYGGISNHNGSDAIITNSTVNDNRNVVGIYNDDATLTLTNSLVNDNVTSNNDGGGFYNTNNASANIINSIFWGNSDGYSNPPQYIINSGTITFKNSLIEGVNPTGTDNIDATVIGFDPLFTDEDNGDYTLLIGSPLIDAGLNNANTEPFDLAGNERVFYGLIDIGVYESVSSSHIYVDLGATTGANNGTSWDNAYTDLQTALDRVTENGQVWVAKGTYLPTESPDGSATDVRNNAFHINKNVKLYGGFAGTETAIDQRTVGNTTILSGDLGTVTDISDNAYHVLVTIGLNNAAVLDGFTITAGNANGTINIFYKSFEIQASLGGGISNYQSFLKIVNVNFEYNYGQHGAGMYNSQSNTRIQDVVFNSNEATSQGGGMRNYVSSVSLTNTVFINNTAAHGGGMYNSYSNSSLVNISFINNSASTDGGGLYNNVSTPSIDNTFFYNNRVDTTLDDVSSSNDNEDSLTAQNNASDVASSTLAAVTVDLSSITDADTIFTDIDNPAGDDGVFGTNDDGLIPIENSPLIDAGTNTGITAMYDLAGNTRILDDTIDIGAYEYVVDTPLSIATERATGVSMYPNPTTGNVIFSLLNGDTLQNITLYSVLGKKVYSSTSASIDITHLPIGMYVARITTVAGKLTVKRIVKQ